MLSLSIVFPRACVCASVYVEKHRPIATTVTVALKPMTGVSLFFDRSYIPKKMALESRHDASLFTHTHTHNHTQRVMESFVKSVLIPCMRIDLISYTPTSNITTGIRVEERKNI